LSNEPDQLSGLEIVTQLNEAAKIHTRSSKRPLPGSLKNEELAKAFARKEHKKDCVHFLILTGFMISFALATIIVISAVFHLLFPDVLKSAEWNDINKLALIIISGAGGLLKDRIKELFD
jgi:hypothetical protein